MAHTPGPWKQGKDWQDIEAHDPLDSPRPWGIATVADSCGYGNGSSESQANARLIAAAPDLLAACKGMAEEAANILANDDPSSDKGQASQALLDAIAKAEKEPS